MRVYWHYGCDLAHHWVVERDDDLEPEASEKICSEGHPAVTESRYPAVDQVEIRLRPAGRIVNPQRSRTRQTLHENKYFLVLSTVGGRDETVSEKVYDWRTVLGLMERFQGRPVAESIERMKTLGL